jgi:periplasmic mercuric ion binding protein
MKNSFVLFVLTFICLSGIQNLHAQQSSNNEDKYQEARFHVSVHCTSCKEKIEREMAFSKGVKNATVDVESKIVLVSYDPKKTNPETIKGSISKLGYDVITCNATGKCINSKDCCEGKTEDCCKEKTSRCGDHKNSNCKSKCR